MSFAKHSIESLSSGFVIDAILEVCVNAISPLRNPGESPLSYRSEADVGWATDLYNELLLASDCKVMVTVFCNGHRFSLPTGFGTVSDFRDLTSVARERCVCDTFEDLFDHTIRCEHAPPSNNIDDALFEIVIDPMPSSVTVRNVFYTMMNTFMYFTHLLMCVFCIRNLRPNKQILNL